MPTYEYQCLTNGHRFEVKQAFTDDALTTCQVCEEPVRKVFSAAGIVFKGSGYYVNDSRAPEKSSNGSGGSGEGDKSSGGGKDKSTDSASTSKDTSSKGSAAKETASSSKAASTASTSE